MDERFTRLHSVAYQFNPERLRIARELRGLKKNELALKLGLTPSSITQFENGVVKPTTGTVAQLCLVLRFPASFFSSPSSVPSISHEQCHFRSLQSCSQIERRRIVAAGSLIIDVVQFIEERIDLPAEGISSTTHFGIRGNDEIEEAANTVRRDWGLGLGPIENLLHLLESRGVLVFKLLEDNRKLDAFSYVQNDRPLIFLNSEKQSASRNRFDLAHELGHLILHSECLPGNKQQESEANRFASAFLLPSETFLKECPKRLVWKHFIELKERWKVSLAALVRRARDLNRISEDTYRRANYQISKNGWKRNEPEEPESETPSILQQALELLEGEGYSLSRIATELSINEIDLRWLAFNEQKGVDGIDENDTSISLDLPQLKYLQ